MIWASSHRTWTSSQIIVHSSICLRRMQRDICVSVRMQQMPMKQSGLLSPHIFSNLLMITSLCFSPDEALGQADGNDWSVVQQRYSRSLFSSFSLFFACFQMSHKAKQMAMIGLLCNSAILVLVSHHSLFPLLVFRWATRLSRWRWLVCCAAAQFSSFSPFSFPWEFIWIILFQFFTSSKRNVPRHVLSCQVMSYYLIWIQTLCVIVCASLLTC